MIIELVVIHFDGVIYGRLETNLFYFCQKIYFFLIAIIFLKNWKIMNVFYSKELFKHVR